MQLVIGNWHIQISKMAVPTKDRVAKVYARRRSKGYCVQCGSKVEEISPYTSVLYRKCKKCRERENKLARLRRNKI